MFAHKADPSVIPAGILAWESTEYLLLYTRAKHSFKEPIRGEVGKRKKLHRFERKLNLQFQDNFLAKEKRENEKRKKQKVYQNIASANRTSKGLLGETMKC